MVRKICSKCKLEKDITDFYKRLDRKCGTKSQCKVCDNSNSIKWKENNSERKKVYDKKYKENNPDKIKKTQQISSRKYYYKNKSKINYSKKERLKLDVIFKIKNSVRSRIRGFLKKKNIQKNNSTFNIIGCSPEYLKQYLEEKFTHRMSWENYGFYGWHIDHIISLDNGKTEDEIYKLCHYTNLQPLWCDDNWAKSNKNNQIAFRIES